jgi:hypothetical protein
MTTRGVKVMPRENLYVIQKTNLVLKSIDLFDEDIFVLLLDKAIMN